jgi:hypothetical protein
LTYRQESDVLDADILRVIAAWHSTGRGLNDAAFDALALRLFDYQLRYNQPYARYCTATGRTSPRSWLDIPPVPAGAFKEAALATFDTATAALTFETSGTTAARAGRHYLETSALYDAALLAGFDRFMLPDGARLRYFNLVPNPGERPQSSLGYMMQQVSRCRGIGEPEWFLRGDALAFDEFVAGVESAVAQAQPICITTTAFALVHVLDALDELRTQLPLPAGSRVMETGGFKGRTRVVDRSELYERTGRAFALPRPAIGAEYGMTELTSQYYDDVLTRGDVPSVDARRKHAPPWLRTRVVGADGSTLPNGTVGALVHVDLANRSSCIAIATEDLGVQFDPSGGDAGGLMLIGRERGASLRGCSLDAETLQPR